MELERLYCARAFASAASTFSQTLFLLTAASRLFYLQPDQQRSFANGVPIARHSVLTNVASVALFAATRRRIMNTFFVQKICRTSLLWLDAAEPISANIIRPV